MKVTDRSSAGLPAYLNLRITVHCETALRAAGSFSPIVEVIVNRSGVRKACCQSCLTQPTVTLIKD